MKLRLADSHCHLDDAQFDADRAGMMERARESGVELLLAIGTGAGPPDLKAAIRVAEAWDGVFATVGVHPNDTPKIAADTFNHLQELLAHPKVRAVGEIGLDYHWGTPKEEQLPAFVEQLAIAREARLPVVIHTRDAWADTLELLRTHWAPTGLPCVMHCFTGDVRQAEECLELGFHLAFGGVTTFPKSAAIREAARITRADKLLIETDAPYLAPAPYRGKRNEPAYVAETAKVIAEVRGLPVAELAEQTTRNLERLLIH